MTTPTATSTDDTEDRGPSSSSSSAVRPRQPSADHVAVRIRGAVKTYDRVHAVLKGLDVTVPKGKIYGLLGPSGCGKTTLLSVIVGRIELESGDIFVDATKREDIGYMPQHLKLHTNLTILQTFIFYGRMFNMRVDKILQRVDELSTLLEIPTNNCLIDTLSGGQQRRVSLGITLLHNPNILILDEPTVGLDPLLSHSIWNYLETLAEGGKTIIVTTHYIEEARQAHTIGMMRDGILVAEDSPEMLMAHCNTTTLEDTFLMLSQKQETLLDNKFDGSLKKPKTKLIFKESAFRKNRIESLLYKNLHLSLRSSFTILLLFLPFITTYCFNQAIGRDPQGLNIAVVNDELQQRHIEKCEPDYYNECFLDRPQDIIMSCAYIELIRSKSLNIVNYYDVDSASMAMHKNVVWGLLYFPANYTRSMAIRFTNLAETSKEHMESSVIQATLDLSSKLCYFLPVLFTLGLVLTEKEEGMMERMMVSGIQFSEVVVSTVITQLVLYVVQAAIAMYMMYVYFDNPYVGRHVPAMTVILLLGMEGMILGFLIAALCDNFMMALYAVAGLNMSYCITCELVWPLEGSHYLIRTIGPFLPLNAPIKALVAITAKGWSFGSAQVYTGLISMFCWSCIKIFGMIIISKFDKDLWISKK